MGDSLEKLAVVVSGLVDGSLDVDSAISMLEDGKSSAERHALLATCMIELGPRDRLRGPGMMMSGEMNPDAFREWAGLVDAQALRAKERQLEESLVDMSTWPSVFVTGQVNAHILSSVEAGSLDAKLTACADALSAWSNCLAGNKTPKKFGEGMIALAAWAGLSVTDLLAENVKAVADAVIAARDAKKTSP